ncbi:Flp pilus assembly protein TadD, contains TPR repeats [Novosphingobium panipatense]|uniref:Flp pilus assembly protein TadD, contains TPR repeats n=3 Tax=Novosphingobium panipatense TaxID=428991 RepID=A0ABY1PZP7_9SPHN|nr:Flp pilus assembly protein TadD, contains TPR repeats [Novosphingobium panipatense]
MIWDMKMKNRHNSHARSAGFTLCSAMVAALLAGCAGGPTSLASANGTQVVAAANQPGVSEAALAKLEKRVLKAPRDASARGLLGQAYLAVGRFDSAATALEDALSLGDSNPRSGLGLALAYIGLARNADALEVLGRWSTQLPVSDYGLAIALAGQPAYGVTVLSEAIRGGDNSVKMRQNLAYAYALDGRWGEARLIASQDLTGDELDTRLREWASRAHPELGRQRVASLLGAPLRSDPGQPAALALGGRVPAPQIRTAASEPGELPPMEAAAPVTPFAGIVQTALSDGEASVSVAAEAAPPPRVEPRPAGEARARPKPARTSVERAFAGMTAPAAKMMAPAAKEAAAAPAARPKPEVHSGTHLVQLGSFRTLEGAKRAWGILQKQNPSLRGRTLRIIEADVRGERYFRVAAEGFGANSAQAMCSTVRKSGQQCLAYADDRPQPGTGRGEKPLLARR